MNILELVNDFKSKNIQNNKLNPNGISEYLNKTLEIRKYMPFGEKRKIAEMVVSANTTEVDGVKKNDSISQYISFVVAAITAHTNLEFDPENVYTDYDALAESGLLPHIIQEFKESYDELDILLKMALADEMGDNNLNIIVGKFLNGILGKLDVITGVLGKKVEDFDIKDIIGNFKEEDLAKLTGLLDKIK